MPEHDIPVTAEVRAESNRMGTETMARLGLNPTTVETWEDGYRTSEEPTSFEWWYFDTQLDDGSNIVVTFSTKPHTHPEGPLQPQILLIHRTADGQSTKTTLEVPAEQFHADSGRDAACNVAMGPHTVSGDLATYSLHVETDDLTVDMTITRQGPSWRPQAAYNYFDKEQTKYLAWVVPVPYGTVDVTLTHRDGSTTTQTGTAYHDHNWGNTPMGDGLDHWYWGRAHAGDYSLIYVQMTTPLMFGLGGWHLPVFYLAKGEEILTDDGLSLTLTTSGDVEGPGGQHYPTRLVWTWNRNAENDPDGNPDDYGTVTLTVTDPKLIEVLDMTEGMTELRRRWVHLFKNPLYYDFDAPVTLEVNLKGINETVTGRTLYEKMMFR